MKKALFVLSAVALLAACGQEAKDAPKPAPASVQATLVPATPPTDQWVGKWVGVEGLVLDIQPGDGPGKYALAVTLMDGTENYEGTAKGETIAFTRDGKTETVRKATGEQTGLKYLAGKTNCLMIKSGEGFCRG